MDKKISEISCPYCGSEKFKRDGNTLKGSQRFFCYLCRKYWQASYIHAQDIIIEDQKKLFNWIKVHPILADYWINIPKSVSQKRSDQSYDVLLAYPNTPYQGVWIHLKNRTDKPSTVSDIFNPRLQAMLKAGYEVLIAYGWQEAILKIENYLLTVDRVEETMKIN